MNAIRDCTKLDAWGGGGLSTLSDRESHALLPWQLDPLWQLFFLISWSSLSRLCFTSTLFFAFTFHRGKSLECLLSLLDLSE